MKLSVSRPVRAAIAVYSADRALRNTIAGHLAGVGAYQLTLADTDAFLSGHAGHPAPAAVILDVGAGALLEDGRLQAARQKWGAVPIVAISQNMSPDRARQLVRLRAVDWLQQPVAAGELIGEVTHAS